MSNIRYEDHYDLDQAMYSIEHAVNEALNRAVSDAAQEVADEIIDWYAEDVDIDVEREEVEDAVANQLLDAYYARLRDRHKKVSTALNILMVGVKAQRKGEEHKT